MTTLKQVLIVVAAMALGAHASPLSADDPTTTSIIGAPEPVITEVSQALKGKELEDYLAGFPHIPEGAIDINGTALADELIKFHAEHGNETAPLVKRGGCSQGSCPDYNAPFDFMEQHIVVPVWGNAVTYWAYWGRWNDCGQCGMFQISKGGCWDFTSCGREQSICVDKGNQRAHRIWKDVNHKTCYRINTEYLVGCGVPITAVTINHPVAETACNW